MLEEGATNMDKKSRPSSVPPKNGASSDSKKNDNNSPNKFVKYGKKRESNGGRGGPLDYARRPTPQKSRTTGDKRPRSRGYCNDRQREEVTESEDPEYGSPLFTGGSKKANLNHLLNFTFAGRDTGSSGVYRGGRKPRTFGRVYNKERFLQANCQFVVGDCGDYAVHSIEVDTLVDWDLVEQVRMTSHETPTCPICLQVPQAGKITRCGHIYCWACVLHYLELGDKKWRKCPICYDVLTKKDLKSVQVQVVHAYKPGERITMRLMKRERGSTYSVPLSQWEKRDGQPHRINDTVNTEFVKLLVASPSQIQDIIVEPEKAALQRHMATAEDSEVCFIESAMVLLKEREEHLLTRSVEPKKTKAARKPEAVRSVQKSTKLKETTLSKDNSSAYSDDSKSQSVLSPEDQAALLPLPESPTLTKHPQHQLPESPHHPLESPLPSLQHSPAESQPSFSFPDLPQTTLTDESNKEENNLQEVSPDQQSLSLTMSSNRTSAAVDKPRERSSVSKSSSDSPDPNLSSSISELEQSMNDAIPIEEAAEHLELPVEVDRNPGGQAKTKSFFYFQASDGQHIYLHAVNARCLVRQYGCLEDCPDSITATIVDTERIFMTDELRKRLRYLNHLPLTCEFQVAELALKPPLLSKDTLRYFADDIEKRRRMRQRKIREEKKRSKEIEVWENAKMGKFPEMRINISSASQFPSYDTASSASYQTLQASPDVRSDSPSLSSIASSPPISPSGSQLDAILMATATDSRLDNHSDGEQTSMSFAQMLKAGKTKQAAPAWPRPTEAIPQVPKVARSADSDDSENEDRVPVPGYQESFSCAIQAALDTMGKEAKEARPSTGGKKKKQKQKFTKLFTTSMTRGK